MDEKKRLVMASSSTSGAMEKQAIAAVEQQQQPPPPQQLAQKCPRCDSSNTKFCYYNNYSLSQPRHFCKACKRYWTRGGTLRNVPVGGGCRKNKRVKIIRPVPVPPVTTTSTNNRIGNPIFSPNYPNQLNGLGFSSAGELLINGHDFLHNNINMVSSSTAGGGGEVNYSSFSSSCPSMTSLLASTIQHQKFISGVNVQLKDDYSSSFKALFSPLVQNGSGLAAMNKVQGQINYNMMNYTVGNGNGGWDSYLGYQNDEMEEQQVIGLSSSTTDPNYYWSMSNANTTTSNNPPANINEESSVPSLI